MIEYDAYAAQAVPSPWVDGSVVKVVHVPQVHIPEIQTLEAVLHEHDDEELRCDDLEEICYMTRMNRKRLWIRVWHG